MIGHLPCVTFGIQLDILNLTVFDASSKTINGIQRIYSANISWLADRQPDKSAAGGTKIQTYLNKFIVEMNFSTNLSTGTCPIIMSTHSYLFYFIYNHQALCGLNKCFG